MKDRKILIVDDDEDILLIVQTLLTNAGYSASIARNGPEGIDLATKLRPDVILLDVTMPQISGWEVCATLKNLPETAATPIVMLTVKSEIRDLITGMQVGADDYITKPFTKRKLLDTVESLLDGGAEPRASFLPKEASDARTRNLLFDAVSGLPTIPLLVDALREWLLVDQEVGVLFIDFEKYSHIEDFYGWEVFDDVLREAAKALKRLLGTLFSTEDLIAINRPSGSEYYVFLTVPPGLPSEEVLDRLQKKARQVEESLRQTLNEKFQDRIQRKIGLYVGYSKIVYSPQVRLERLVYRALREAITVASSKEGERAALLREQFKDVLLHKRIRTVYQPIVDLKTNVVFAHEALSRGPADTSFESPEVLFDYALRTDQVWGLENVCMAFAAERFTGRSDGMLFVNMETQLIHDLKSRGHEVLKPLMQIPNRVVLEITERAAIRDYSLFRESVSLLRSLGFTIAIDDAGSGYASLQSIAELRPNFLKISNYLVTGLHDDSIKRDVVEMLVRLAARIDAQTVAEGIETEEELNEVKSLGITFGQGYFLGRPAPLEG
jgi:EAL domain-containing protein (putative c-di-GMP-specific phosphodiesterase class I)/FixJ family two-component response regulator